MPHTSRNTLVLKLYPANLFFIQHAARKSGGKPTGKRGYNNVVAGQISSPNGDDDVGKANECPVLKSWHKGKKKILKMRALFPPVSYQPNPDQ